MLTQGQRWWRTVVTVTGLALLVAGTLYGQDDHFPFGPFRMFSTATEPGGQVRTAELWVRTADGREEQVVAEGIGLRRAELEGQLPRLRDDPAGLADVAAAWRRAHPGSAELVEVRVVERVRDLDGSRVVAEERRVRATWMPG